MKKFITLIAAVATVSAFAFDFKTDSNNYNTIVSNLKKNKVVYAEAPIVAAEELLKDMDASGIAQQSDKWKLKYLKVFSQVQYQRNRDRAFADSLKIFNDKAKEIGLSDNVDLGEKLDSMFVFYNDKQVPDVYNYLKSLKDTSWKKTFFDGGYYAHRMGNYEEAYNWYMERGFFYNRAMMVAIENLNDYNKAVAAAKGVSGNQVPPDILEHCVEIIINKLYSNAKNKAEIITILEDINFTYSQYLNKEGDYINAITKVRQTLDAYYSVKR